MENIANYIEQLGYTVEEQGTINKFLIVFDDGMPLGFILSDLSVRLTGDLQDDRLEKIIKFVDDNKQFDSVGVSEFLLIKYRQHQLTTRFDAKNNTVKYTSYIVDDKGEVKTIEYQDEQKAIYGFCTSTGMIDFKDLGKNKMSLKEKVGHMLLKN